MNWPDISNNEFDVRMKQIPAVIRNFALDRKPVRDVVERHLNSPEWDRECMITDVIRILLHSLEHQEQCVRKLTTIPPWQG